MTKKHIFEFSTYRTAILFILDSGFIAMGYLLSFLIRLDFDFVEIVAHNNEEFIQLCKWLPAVVAIHIVCFLLFKVNRSLWRYFSLNEVIRVVYATVLANMIWLLLVVGSELNHYIRSVPMIASSIVIIELLGLRIGYRIWRRTIHQAKKIHRALIVGAGDAGAILGRELQYNDQHQCKLVGYIDDDPAKHGKLLLGYPILGNGMNLGTITKQWQIDVIYIAIPSASRGELTKLLDRCNQLQLPVKIMNYREDPIGKTTGIIGIRDVSMEDLLGRGEIILQTEDIQSYVGDKVILVTGAGGSIGSELCRQLLKFHPKQIVMLDFYENNLYELQQEIMRSKRHGQLDDSVDLVYLIANVQEKSRIDEIISCYRPHVVYHAAAHKHVPLMEDCPKEAIKNNVMGTYQVIASCVEHKVGKFILISTDKAEQPTNVMAASKRLCELIVQGMKHNGTTKIGSVRFGNVLGTHGSVIPLFQQQIADGGPITVTDKDIIRFFMTTPDVAQLVLQAGAYVNHGEVFALDMGKPVKVLKLAEDLIQFSGFRPYEEIGIEFTGLRPGEKIFDDLSPEEKKYHKTQHPLIYMVEPSDIQFAAVEETIQYLLDLLKRNTTENEWKDDLLQYIQATNDMSFA